MINHILKYCRNTFVLALFIFFTTVLNAQNNALILNGAVTVLNGGTAATPIYLVVNQNNPSGIIRNSGHIHSENQYNYLKWVAGTGTGNYVFPFGVGATPTDYIPFTFNKTTAIASDVQLSTWFTNTQNFPKPAATNVGAVTNMFGNADSVLYAIDRFWDIQASATADLTFSYRGIENTTINQNDTVKTQHWNGLTWDAQVGPGNLGVTSGIGSAGPFVGQNTFSPWILSVVPVCPEDTISYTNTPFCNNTAVPQSVTHTNSLIAGTYSATPAGLDIDVNTGDINPSLSTPGTYTVTFTIAPTSLCPQFDATTTVTINSISTSTDVQTACNSLTWIDGINYVASTNTPTFTIVGGSATGCDSIVTLNLTINPTATSTDVQTACNSLTWIDGINYTASANTPTFIIVGGSSAGCDSVVTLNLTINTFVSSTDFQTACNSLTWIDGINYNASTNTPTFTIVSGSATGCDSIVTLNLTINPTATSTDVQTACNSLTWIDGINYTASTNTPTFIIVGGSAAGCDSVVNLNLTINPTTTSTDVQTACNSLTWIDGINYAASTNTPTFTIIGGSASGCDSIVTLNLTINPTATSTDVQTACNSLTWIDGINYTASTNTPTFTIIGGSAAGCDSVVTLNLTINPQLSAIPDLLLPICLGDPIILTAISSGNGTITWYSDAAGTTIIGTGSPCSPAPIVSATGLHTFYVNEVGTCSSTLTAVDLAVGGVIAVFGATPSSGFIPLDVVFTNGSTTGPSITYSWVFGDGSVTSSLFEPSHTYTNLGNYLATLTVSDGVCSATASLNIEAIGESSILIPNVFTPNGDGKNDVFTVEGTNLESVDAEIFNRWGMSMYNWNQVNGSWNGRTTSGSEAPDGTYFYIITAKGLDGAEYFKKGAFSLIR